MKLEENNLKKLLVSQSYVSAEDVKNAEVSAKHNKTSFVDELIAVELLTPDLLGQAIAESLSISYTDLNSHPPSREQVNVIPDNIGKVLRIIFISKKGNIVTIATDNPTDKRLRPTLKKLFPRNEVAVTYSLEEDIQAAFVHYKKSLDTRFSKIIKAQKRVAPEILDEILHDAFTFQASDIHFEPQVKDVIVRFRVDGILYEAGRLPKDNFSNILNRVKVQNNMRIDEHYSTQDGSMQVVYEGQTVDVRTSIAPTVQGEKIVLRLLKAYTRSLTLTDLGFQSSHQELVNKAARKPFGMILVVGPTGSGKTTTLYSVLKILNTPEVNITTIEDPVEYKVPGVNQIQINEQKDITFAKGLRSIVRQDPDIILVGEIRDTETAEIGVNAALTGHLLLTTFHANDAATAIPRLLDMDVEPFLLASTLEVIIAQRLVRKICETCRTSVKVSTGEMKAFFKNQANVTLYKGKGCSRCDHTGYKGRTAIFEIIQITPEMQDLILQGPSTKQIWTLARQQGALSLFEDGIDKVKKGVTTLQELQRIAEPPKFEVKISKNVNPIRRVVKAKTIKKTIAPPPAKKKVIPNKTKVVKKPIVAKKIKLIKKPVAVRKKAPLRPVRKVIRSKNVNKLK